jgi:hypothetical protein
MTRAVLLLASIVLTQACSRAPGPKDCQALLQADAPDSQVVRDLISRVEPRLSKAPADGSDPELEALGLCVGALKRKAGLSE